jgi:hypothetical protein
MPADGGSDVAAYVVRGSAARRSLPLEHASAKSAAQAGRHRRIMGRFS